MAVDVGRDHPLPRPPLGGGVGPPLGGPPSPPRGARGWPHVGQPPRYPLAQGTRGWYRGMEEVIRWAERRGAKGSVVSELW